MLGRVGKGRVDRFVWVSVCVAIFILKACTYFVYQLFFISLFLYSVKNATKQHSFLICCMFVGVVLV